MASGSSFVGIVLYTGKEVLRFAPQMWAVPISALWQNLKGSEGISYFFASSPKSVGD